jgi:hypothetical protein
MRPSAERPLAAGEKKFLIILLILSKMKIIKIESIPHTFIYLKFHTTGTSCLVSSTFNQAFKFFSDVS